MLVVVLFLMERLTIKVIKLQINDAALLNAAVPIASNGKSIKTLARKLFFCGFISGGVLFGDLLNGPDETFPILPVQRLAFEHSAARVKKR